MIGKARLVLSLAALTVLTLYTACTNDPEDTMGGGVCEVDGHVMTEAGGAISGVKVKAYITAASEGNPTSKGSTSTDSRGYYRLTFEVPALRLTLMPTGPSCVFRPPSVVYADPAASIHGVDFTGYCGETHRIEGNVLLAGGEPVAGVALAVRDHKDLWNKPVLTDAAGYYFVDDLVPGLTYVVTPTRAYYRFEPASRTYENLSQSLSAQDYVATALR